MPNIAALIEQARRDGYELAMTEMKSRYESSDDLPAAQFERDAYGDDANPECNVDDEYDSRGNQMLPRFNDAGEPWWM